MKRNRFTKWQSIGVTKEDEASEKVRPGLAIHGGFARCPQSQTRSRGTENDQSLWWNSISPCQAVTDATTS